MGFFLFLIIFIGLPIGELFLLIETGQHIGAWRTIGLVVFTGILGAWLARWQGVQTLRKIGTEMQAGRMPAPEMVDGALILAAGLVLLTPGFITDALGLLLLIPTTRNIFKRIAKKVMRKKILHGTIEVRHREW